MATKRRLLTDDEIDGLQLNNGNPIVIKIKSITDMENIDALLDAVMVAHHADPIANAQFDMPCVLK